MTSAAHDYETVIPLDQAPPVAELARRAGRNERIRLVAAGGDAVVVLSAGEHQANIDDIVMLAEALQANSGGGITLAEQCDLDDVADAMDAVGSAVVAAVDAAIMRRSTPVPAQEYVAARTPKRLDGPSPGHLRDRHPVRRSTGLPAQGTCRVQPVPDTPATLWCAHDHRREDPVRGRLPR